MNRRLDETEKRISELEHRAEELKERSKKKNEKKYISEDGLRDLQDIMQANIHIIGVPERKEKEKGTEIL